VPRLLTVGSMICGLKVRSPVFLSVTAVVAVLVVIGLQSGENQTYLSNSNTGISATEEGAKFSHVSSTDRDNQFRARENRKHAIRSNGALSSVDIRAPDSIPYPGGATASPSDEYSDILGESNEKECSGGGVVNTLCVNRSSLVVFSRMTNTVKWQLYAHKEEAEKCTLLNNVTCFFTDDYSYYQTADVLLARDCSDLCNQPAYPDQLILRYNRGPAKGRNPKCRKRSSHYMRVSFELSSTIPYPYMCWPDTKRPLIDVLKLGPPSGRHGVAMFVSDGVPWRKKYLTELIKYVHIDSYGSVLHNTDVPPSRGKGSDNFISVKLDLIKTKRYKFLIAFENSVVSEYVSEKIWHAYLSQTIPIYYGTSDVYDQVPGANTFIDATKIDGPQQLAEYINMIEEDDSLYKSFFNFDINHTLKFQQNCPQESLGCAMCRHLYQVKQERCKFSV